MRPTILLILGVALGVCCGLGGALLLDGPAPGPRNPIAGQADADDAWRKEVRSRLDAIEARLAEIQRGRSAISVDLGGGAGASPAGAAQKAIPRASTEWAEMSAESVLAAAANLRRREKNVAGARKAVEHLLGRRLRPVERAKALTELGRLETRAGALEAAERAFRRAIDQAGDSADERAWAGYELALTLRKRERKAEGLRVAEAAAAIAGTSKWVRVHCRWALGVLSMETGDLARARSVFDKLMTEVDEDRDTFRWCVDDIRDRLKRL